MLYLIRNSKKLFLPAILILILAGCQIFDDAKHALNYFCPGLNIDINGVHEQTSKNHKSAIKTYLINYPEKYAGQVEKYFQEGNGYSAINSANVFGVNTDEVIYVDQNDKIIGKGFKSGIDSAIVAFDRTKQEIIIIEYLTNPNAKR